MLTALQPGFGRWLDGWLKQRLPETRKITLRQRQIFIVPGKLAFGLLALIVLLFILAANFQNSLIYAVCFWLLALLVLNILHTYRNLSGLSITVIRAAPCFAGEQTVLELELSRPEKRHQYALNIGWPEQDTVCIDLIDNQTMRVKISHATETRGHFTPPRLTVSSRYPTGLAVAWSYITPAITAIVYPAPKSHPLSLTEQDSGQTADSGQEIPGGSQDFGGIRDYQRGDTPRHIHWGKYAQTGTLYTKTFVDYQTQDRWLDWDKLRFPGTEARLSHLCSEVIRLHHEQQTFGLRLPGTCLAPDQGESHRSRCLHALALYGLETPTSKQADQPKQRSAHSNHTRSSRQS